MTTTVDPRFRRFMSRMATGVAWFVLCVPTMVAQSAFPDRPGLGNPPAPDPLGMACVFAVVGYGCTVAALVPWPEGFTGSRRPARQLAALPESSEYARYEDDPPP
ncbi:hypothetical protein [Streptomyces sp. NPDC087270]|uniref:hypothetical protein n=1 Tax=Streptomyces sp. NPDC087270 TaxID=3365774 RepID=UPI003820FCDC